MATFTTQDVITEVRAACQDELAPYRYDDAHILRAVNHCLKRIALLRPDLFAVSTTYTCILGVRQPLPADCIRVIDILQVVSGVNVNEVNRQTLDLALSTWQIGVTGSAQDWMRDVRNPYQFFLYPPSPAGQQLVLDYAQAPPVYTLGQTVATISDAYFPALVDCVVWWIESYDNESVANKRAEMFQQSFQQLLGFTAQVKPVTDTPEGGLKPDQVVS